LERYFDDYMEEDKEVLKNAFSKNYLKKIDFFKKYFIENISFKS
jgi:hypothetical protein